MLQRLIKSKKVSASSSSPFEHSGEKHVGGHHAPFPMSDRVNVTHLRPVPVENVKWAF